MKMYPAHISPRTRSSAEKKLFRWLEAGSIDGYEYCLHSQNLKEHERKRVAEIDFLLLGTRGALVLEVKGGRVRPLGQKWEFTDRDGNVSTKDEGPFEQAQGAMFALEGLLKKDRVTPPGSVPMGFGAVFPDIAFLPKSSAAWAKQQVIDNDVLAEFNGLERGILRLSEYWRAKSHDPTQVKAVSSDVIISVLEYLRPRVEAAVSLRSLSNEWETELIEYSQAALRVLDTIQGNKRIFVQGSAGTGKTQLALEITKRKLAENKKVLFTARNQNVVELIARDNESDNLTAATFERSKYLQEQNFDYLVVDEAQDLLTFEDLEPLGAMLKGGFDKGHWALFMDPVNQTGLDGTFDALFFETLKEQSAYAELTQNCRNTPAIVEFVQSELKVTLEVSGQGFGEKPNVIKDRHQDDRVSKLAAWVRQLDAQGIEPRDIVFLSPKKFEESIFALLPNDIRELIVDMSSTSWINRPLNKYSFSTIAMFKGLESKWVALEEPSKGENSSNEKYVGYTRARHGLTVVRSEK